MGSPGSGFTPQDWVTLFSSIGAVLAAGIAGFFAIRAKSAEVRAQRVRDLEARLAKSRYEVYEPILELFREMFLQGKAGSQAQVAKASPKQIQAQSRFNTWIQMYGSDEAVLAYHRFMQAIYKTGPSPIVMRYYAEFILAARRDLGDPSTAVTPTDLLGILLTDIHTTGLREDLEISEDALHSKYEWDPPWKTP